MGGKSLIAVVCIVVMVLIANQSHSRRVVRCRGSRFARCNGQRQQCPQQCPDTCQMDCETCKAVCSCDKPGGVCQDPRFIGGDGIMFYFHGKKEQDLCLVSDSDLHINAHFMGKRGDGMGRDFTWVQSIGLLFHGTHRLFVGAKKVATWNDSIDQLGIALDGKSITLPQEEGASLSVSPLKMNITRLHPNNEVIVEVEDKFKITAHVVPITPEESRIHNYGITSDDCFAHLELSFKFHSRSPHVSGVLGQTYAADYTSPINLGLTLPLMGSEANYLSSNLFATDCKVARFRGAGEEEKNHQFSILDLNCAGELGGSGMVCRR
ncbi:uncharacterized protein LOC131042750 [Cryptomeria japonica]|uniref:uncharacterized protein LOC131042750 n=1 Tax=Cryptomeria japonica TaxID=3369 RepID=UPI0027DAAE72|nr:uncharacterized protein LOC131042750 [Cryptomeria japonica]